MIGANGGPSRGDKLFVDVSDTAGHTSVITYPPLDPVEPRLLMEKGVIWRQGFVGCKPEDSKTYR